jgi:4-aminobutyrate--pyruvate transaminase
MAALRSLSANPLVGDVRGRGLLAGVELVRDKQTREPFDPRQQVGSLCATIAERYGLIVRAIGDTISLCPPLIINEDEISEIASRLDAALGETATLVS